MSEKTFQREVINLLRKHGHVQKHNDITPGIPDLSARLREPYNADVWIELKFGVKPARPASIVRMELYPAQKLWLTRRGQAGGECFVLVRVPPVTILYGWEAGCRVVGVSCFEDLIDSGDYPIWRSKPTADELCSSLTNAGKHD